MTDAVNTRIVNIDAELPDANARVQKSNQRHLRTVSAKIIEVDTKKANGAVDSSSEPGRSQALPDEPFSSLAEQGKIIEPPFDMMTLAMLCEHSSELGQCVEAMETNIETFGHRFVSRLRAEATDPTDQPNPSQTAALVESARLQNFFMYCTDESFINFRRKLRRDLEMTGNYYFEVVRNQSGEIQSFTHIPAYQMRLGKLDDEASLVDRKIIEIQADGSCTLKTVKEYRRFRRFVQSRAIYRRSMHVVEAGKARWFKEFGDPRRLHAQLGEFETETFKVPDDKLSTEVVHFKIYSARTPYGVPRYIGNLLSIFGDRAAEEINYITFRNNNIPSMVVAVSNGQLTQGTIDRIKDFVESQIQGSDNYSKFLIVEGEPFGDEGEDGGQVKIDIEPLVQNQHKDALFQNYSANNQDKIRRAFRLPPIFVGRADDYSKATADSSRRLADEQIFAPERDEFDATMNRIIFPNMGILYHKFKTNSPNTTDNAQLVKILAGAEKTGGMTPRIARQVLTEVLGEQLPPFPKDFPADVPFSVTMAEAVKNKADASEPGQQVTALKSLQLLGILGDDGSVDADAFEGSIEDVAKNLMAIQKAAELLWRKQGRLSAEAED